MRGLIVILVICMSSAVFADDGSYNSTSPAGCEPGMTWNSNVNKCYWPGGRRPLTREQAMEARVQELEDNQAYLENQQRSQRVQQLIQDPSPSRSRMGIGYDINTGNVGPMIYLSK